MYSITDLKNHTKIILDGEPYVVIKYSHAQMGRGGAVVKTTLRNLKNGSVLAKTFQGNDKIEPADVMFRQAQFTYVDGDMFYFMDNETYEQVQLTKDVIGDTAYFLVEGNDVDLLYFGEHPINITVKAKVELKVVETPPGVRGDTVSGGTKPATLETGLIIQVPLFINVDDQVRVNTAEKSYVERVKK